MRITHRMSALTLWREALCDLVRGDGLDLSTRQAAILLTIYLTPAPHTVRGLAAGLSLGKPAVTRALDVLEAEGLVRRRKDPDDLRNVLLERTKKGTIYLAGFGQRIARIAHSLELGASPDAETELGEGESRKAAA